MPYLVTLRAANGRELLVRTVARTDSSACTRALRIARTADRDNGRPDGGYLAVRAERLS